MLISFLLTYHLSRSSVDTFVVPLHPFLVFLVVLARVGGLVTFAPFWAHRAAPAKVRVVLAAVLAIVLTPAVMPKIATPPSEVIALTLVLMGEIVIGMALGFVGRLVFAALEVAAHFVGAQMGFSLAGTIDPSTQAQTAAFGIAAQMLGLVVLLAADGHHWFLAATVKSFGSTAPGTFVLTAQLAEVFVRLSADAIAVGVSLAAPAIIVLMVVEFALEFFGRTAPGFQMFILGFPIKIGVGLWLLGASAYFMPNALRDVLSLIYTNLLHVLQAM